MRAGQYQRAFLAGLLAALSLGIACAAWLQITFSAAWPYLIVLLLFGTLASWCLVLRKSERTWIAFLGLFFILGLARFAAAYELPQTDISHFAGMAALHGTVTEEPRVTVGKDHVMHIRYTVAAERVIQEGKPYAARGHAYIYTRCNSSDAHPIGQIGDALTAVGKLRRPHGYQNPGQIDTAFLLRSQGITASLSAGNGQIRISSAEHPSLSQRFMRWAASVRAHYMENMKAVMPDADAAVIFAMLFGGYAGIRPEVLEAFTTTGIVHILSVSGSHISLVAAVTAWIATFLRLPKWLGAVSVTAIIVLYVVLAGLVPPAVRSGIMGGAAFLGLVLGRERDAQRILLITGILMLLLSPLLLFHISFQLSFLATAGLLFLAPIFREHLHRLPSFIAGSLAITISAQLATLPILAWYFNQLSLSALLANLVVVPLVELVIVLGLFGGVAAFIFPMLGLFVFSFDSLLLGGTFELTRFIALLPAAQVWVPSIGVGWGLCYYGVLVLMILPPDNRGIFFSYVGRYRYALGGTLITLLAALFFRYAVHPDEMTVHFIDVGQGDCALVVTPHGHAMLFDTGGTRDGAFDIGARVDVPYLLHYGIRSVDYIFLSHAHEDHAAGAGAILTMLPVQHVFTADEGTAAYARSMRMGDGNPLLLKFSRIEAGQTVVLDGVTVETIYAPDYDPANHATGNEVSNVYRVCYGEARFLFTGDLVKEHEERMLAAGAAVASTVVKMPHHGSDTSSSEAFVKAAHPLYAVCCVGADNAFGHPRPDVLARYERVGAAILRTDRDGAIVFRTDGRHMTAETFVHGKIPR